LNSNFKENMYTFFTELFKKKNIFLNKRYFS